MKPMPSADENRRLAEVQIEKAAKLPTGSTRESHLKKARDYESSAHSDDWRNAHLQAPDWRTIAGTGLTNGGCPLGQTNL